MDQALTNKKFIEQIDDVIETLGGTPVDLELTEDREDDMVSNDVFIDKMDEVIEALGGTPSEIIVGDDKADDMVSDNIFQLKMEDVVKNMSGSGGGGGGSSDFSTATLTLTVTGGEDYLAEIYRGFTFNGDMYLTNEVSSSNEFTVLLYNGTANIDIYGDGEAPITDITGDFTLDEDSSNSGTMTGNCSMSILGFFDR